MNEASYGSNVTKYMTKKSNYFPKLDFNPFSLYAVTDALSRVYKKIYPAFSISSFFINEKYRNMK